MPLERRSRQGGFPSSIIILARKFRDQKLVVTHTGNNVGRGGCSELSERAKKDSFGTSKPPSSTGGALVVLIPNGGLCGRGDISIASCAGPGEDEGMGGVVVLSGLCYQHICIQLVAQGRIPRAPN